MLNNVLRLSLYIRNLVKLLNLLNNDRPNIKSIQNTKHYNFKITKIWKSADFRSSDHKQGSLSLKDDHKLYVKSADFRSGTGRSGRITLLS